MLNSLAVEKYLENHSAVLKAPIFEISLSADVISRQINTAWQSVSKTVPVFTYVSYTQLNDNSNDIKCNATYVGVRSTQVYADTGVYCLNVLNFNSQDPSIIGPVGFDSLGLFGIVQ